MHNPQPEPPLVKCQNEWCARDGAPLHSCPWLEDKDDHETKCTCCEGCRRNCADDI